MPSHKDLKRLVRSRMKKTGEAYTAARVHVLKPGPRTSDAKSKPSSSEDYAQLAGLADTSVLKRTGRTWAEWVRVLDAARATERPHKEIALYVSSLGTPDWWSQMVTVGYERIRGLRVKGQRRSGTYRSEQEPHIRRPGRDTLRGVRKRAHAARVAAGERHGPYGRSAQEHAPDLG